MPRRFAVVIVTLVAVAIGIAAVVQVNSRSTWDPRLAPYIEFVESERGLKFRSPVAVELIDAEDYLTPSVDLFVDPDVVTAYEILGVDSLDPPSVRPIPPSYDGLFAAFVQAPPRVLLPRGFDEKALSVTIVHELTHALQSQNNVSGFGVFNDSNSDDFRIDRALSEGDATRIEHAYYAQLTPAEQQEYLDAGGPPVAGYRDPSWNSTSYSIGEPLVKALIARDGQEQFDEFVRSRVANSTSLYVDVLGDPTQTVDASSEIELPGSVSEATGELGANGWFVTLAPLVGTAAAFDAVIGYDADAFVVFDRPGDPAQQCLRSAVFFDSDDEAVEFATIVATIDVEGEIHQAKPSVTMELCEPLRDPGLQTPSVVLPMVIAQELAAFHLDSGTSSEVARCAAIAQAKTVPHDLDLEDFDGYDDYFSDAAPFVENCG